MGKFYSILVIESSESAESLESSEATHVVTSTTRFQSILILCGLVAPKFPVQNQVQNQARSDTQNQTLTVTIGSLLAEESEDGLE